MTLATDETSVILCLLGDRDAVRVEAGVLMGRRGAVAFCRPRTRVMTAEELVASGAIGRELLGYFARLNSVDGTQPSLPSSSVTFHQMPSFSPVG